MATTRSSKQAGKRAVDLTVLVPPVPASRPRVTRWGTYYLKTYKSYREAADKAIPQSPFAPLEGNLKATIEFVCHRPKTTKRLSPRGDIDNHMKSILDAVVGHKATKKRKCGLKHYIEDDMQISEVIATKRFATKDELPHTRIHIEEL